MENQDNKTIGQLTVAEFLKLNYSISSEKEDNGYLFGINAIAEFLGWSPAKVKRKKKEGFFEDVLLQEGRSISLHRDDAIKIIKNKQNSYGRKRNF